MHKFTKTAFGLATAVAIALAPSTALAGNSYSSAENLRKLDIMLMVTALRCRHGNDNFQRDYERFATKHLWTMNGASNTLQAALSTKYGSKGAKRALDKMSVSMANQYGQGHPWLDCAQLKEVTQKLAKVDSSELGAAAGHLLAPTRSPQFAMIGR